MLPSKMIYYKQICSPCVHFICPLLQTDLIIYQVKQVVKVVLSKLLKLLQKELRLQSQSLCVEDSLEHSSKLTCTTSGAVQLYRVLVLA